MSLEHFIIVECFPWHELLTDGVSCTDDILVYAGILGEDDGGNMDMGTKTDFLRDMIKKNLNVDDIYLR